MNRSWWLFLLLLVLLAPAPAAASAAPGQDVLGAITDPGTHVARTASGFESVAAPARSLSAGTERPPAGSTLDTGLRCTAAIPANLRTPASRAGADAASPLCEHLPYYATAPPLTR